MRRRYEDTSSLVSYQLKTNQQGDIEVYVDDRFVGNVSEGVCNWRDIEYKSKVTISLKGVENDILPSLKQTGFLDTNARNPDITIVGITLTFQFGNALPKYITGCKNITVVDGAARRVHPRAVA